MFHDRTLATAPRIDPRPRSAVSYGCGLAGLAGLVAWLAAARGFGMDGPLAALTALVATAVPMVAWSLLVDRVHRNTTTGIDWSAPKPLRETLDISLVKLAGLWATWAVIALVYGTGRFYWDGDFAFAMTCFAWGSGPLFVASIGYVLWLDRYLVEPRDECWAFGAWLTGTAPLHRDAVANHARAWGVKGFFLAFMLAIVPGGYGAFVRADLSAARPDALSMWLITGMFLVDVMVATVGYLLTLRPLNAHIRSANPYAAGWLAALICYPPFTLMDDAMPLDYGVGNWREDSWQHWFWAHPVLLGGVGAVLVVLTAVYAWSTLAFGLRFSNLTNRGILTHGPFAWTRHPAYLSKNLFWWVGTMPWFTTGSAIDAARATLLLACVSGVYWWRARTEERHLLADPAYAEYWHWMERNGPAPRFFRRLRGATIPR